ncbi:hypothetical protein ACH0BF_22190 [Pseudobacillus sp. 179-B 2D1 NHS]|uniref:hypothetical protein n=1 Tax=Pseudobacillus sp. 179-B 2D1 NHS TaxID=3374292 RepID=UPI003879FDEA
MIEAIFSKGKEPLILEECMLFIGLSWYEIGRTYVFEEHQTHKVGKFKKPWRNRHIVTEHMNYGYFSSLPRSGVFTYELLESESEKAAIIGYSKGKKYYVYGISTDKYRDRFDGKGYSTVIKFRFLELKEISK